MSRKSKDTEHIANGALAEISDQPITDTVRTNFMPYAMYVIRERSIPEIDGFKPSHRKLLYTMYKMGLLTGSLTKSANVVGQTMKLNPHGDAAIYDTMVRLTRGNESLLHPFIESKGSFGKQYSRDMAYAASRYTEVKLNSFAGELFKGIDKDSVDFVDNYDATMKEPVLLPTTFPNVLVSPNLGIAVGMTTNICSFNLAEVCDGTIQLLRNPNTVLDKMTEIIKAPDFPGGGYILYDKDKIRSIYETGRGNVTIRSRYSYDKKYNCIDITQIPYSTSIELIMKKIGDLVKEGRLKEIVDFRDEIDLSGFKLTLDLRRGVDPDKLMAKLFKSTPLQDDFSCNFNVLIDGTPRQMGVIEILNEWISFRMACVRRELNFELRKKQDKLHLLLGLGKILLDIDKAIRIVRETEKESDVVPNLMEGFSIDQMQAEYIAEIKLRNLNREYIINRIQEIESLRDEIAQLQEKIGDDVKIKQHIAAELKEIKRKFAKPRMTQLLDPKENALPETDEHEETYPVRLIFTREGYFKKLLPQTVRQSDEQKLKEGDETLIDCVTDNNAELLFFSDFAQCYKAKASDFDPLKPSQLGEYVPAKLSFDENEQVIGLVVANDYSNNDNIVFIFENGKGVRVPTVTYQTKTNRKKLTAAFSDASRPVAIFRENDDLPDVLLLNDQKKAVILHKELIPVKTTRTSSGVQLVNLKNNQKLVSAVLTNNDKISNYSKLCKDKIPATPTVIDETTLSQLNLH